MAGYLPQLLFSTVGTVTYVSNKVDWIAPILKIDSIIHLHAQFATSARKQARARLIPVSGRRT